MFNWFNAHKLAFLIFVCLLELCHISVVGVLFGVSRRAVILSDERFEYSCPCSCFWLHVIMKSKNRKRHHHHSSLVILFRLGTVMEQQRCSFTVHSFFHFPLINSDLFLVGAAEGTRHLHAGNKDSNGIQRKTNSMHHMK